MVLPSGDLLEVTEDAQPDLMQKIRSSYGLFGITYEVTYKVKPLTPMHVHHTTYELEDFIAKLPDLKALQLLDDVLPLSLRQQDHRRVPQIQSRRNRRTESRRMGAAKSHLGHVRSKVWSRYSQNVSIPSIRYRIIDAFNAAWRLQLENIVTSDYTIPGDQIIDYPPVSNDSRYTFSLFAFPEDEFPAAITDFFKFCKDYYKQKGYRSNLLYVGYRIAQDQKSLLSYSYDGNVMTIDPVSTANPGWFEFLDVYNQWCSDRGGKPLLNQTPQLTPAILQKAYGDKLKVSSRPAQAVRSAGPPAERLLPHAAVIGKAMRTLSSLLLLTTLAACAASVCAQVTPMTPSTTIRVCPGAFPTDLTATDCRYQPKQRILDFVSGNVTDQAILSAVVFGLGAQIINSPVGMEAHLVGIRHACRLTLYADRRQRCSGVSRRHYPERRPALPRLSR